MSSVSNDDRLEPWAQWEEVTVVFGAADTDTVVPHTLSPPTPEQVNYVVTRQGAFAVVYHDATGTRTPWQPTYIVLRCSVANTTTSLLLYVGRTAHSVRFTSPSIASPASFVSPAFTGIPTAPTAAPGTNTTQIATTAFVQAVVIPESQVTGLVTDLAAKAPLAAPALTGAPTAPTATVGTNTTQLATTAFAQAVVLPESQVTGLVADLALKAPLAAPGLTGVPTAPTAALGTSTTQLATTAFVAAAVSVAIPRCTLTNPTQSIPDSTFTALLFSTEEEDPLGLHSTSTNTNRITIPAGAAGTYVITAFVDWAPHATGQRQLLIKRNGVTLTGVIDAGSAAFYVSQVATAVSLLAVNDYIEAVVFQNTGGALGTLAQYNQRFSAVQVSP